jgi:hypothetical protein
MPVGMLLTARMRDEATLFEIAFAYEQATRHRRRPERPAPTGAADLLDVERFNALHDRIGRRVFEDVLGEGEKFDLDGNNFSAIVVEVLREEGLEPLIDP